jgi:hypothetical protein
MKLKMLWTKRKDQVQPKPTIKSVERLTSTSCYKYESDYIFDDIYLHDHYSIKGDLVLINDPLLPVTAICIIDAIIEPGVVFKLSMGKGLMSDTIYYKVTRSISKEAWVYLEFEFLKKDSTIGRFSQDDNDIPKWKQGTQESVFAGEMNKFK